MTEKRGDKIYILGILLLILHSQAYSQCAMCKASLEANIDAGGAKGAGINEGILYLMSMPYLALLIFGVFSYLYNKQNKVKEI